MIDFGSKGKYIMDRHVDDVLMGLGKEVWFTFWWLTRNVVWKKEGVKHKKYGVHMPRGSYLVSRRELADEVDVTEGKMRTILKKLVEIGLIDIQTVEVKTKFGKKKLNHITIIDYDLYQSIGQAEESKEVPSVTQGLTQATQGQNEKRTQEKPSDDAAFADSNTQDEYQSDITFTQALPEHDPSFTQADTSNHAASEGVVTQALPEVYPNYDPKRTNSIKNERYKNEEYNQPSNEDSLSKEEWETDEDYLFCKKQCGWLVGSDSKIYSYFQEAKKHISNQEMIDAWTAYKEKEPIKDQNLATFLSYKYKEYILPEPSSPIIPFGKYAHLMKRSRIPRR